MASILARSASPDVSTCNSWIIATAAPGKHETVLALGADHVLDSLGGDLVAEVLRLTRGAGADLVLESAEARFQLLKNRCGDGRGRAKPVQRAGQARERRLESP